MRDSPRSAAVLVLDQYFGCRLLNSQELHVQPVQAARTSFLVCSLAKLAVKSLAVLKTPRKTCNNCIGALSLCKGSCALLRKCTDAKDSLKTCTCQHTSQAECHRHMASATVKTC